MNTTQCLVAASAVTLATAASAATIEERLLTLDIADGAVHKTERLIVTMEEPGDLESWQRYSISLDDHLLLDSVRAEVLNAAGEIVYRVKRRDLERVSSVGDGLYASAWLQVVPFPPLELGQRLRLEIVTTLTPLYPATSVSLLLDSDQTRLGVEVTAASEDITWRLSSCDYLIGLVVEEQPAGLRVSAHDLQAWDQPADAPARSLAGPRLLISWANAPAWQGVGQWYSELVATSRGEATAARALARQLCPDKGARRDCLETLTRYVKQEVRYVAVEVGPGGWIPSAPDEVLSRGWGDCKDKSSLLQAMLTAVGIPSWLTLIRAGAGGGALDRQFPWPYSFNHCIVAVPSEGLPLAIDDPVVDGMLLVDPTSSYGSAWWLPQSCQGRPALVADDGDSRLIDVPVWPGSEQRELLVDGAMMATGTLQATVTLTLVGTGALPWLDSVRSEPQQQIADAITRVLTILLPRSQVLATSWEELARPAPEVQLRAELTLHRAARGTARRQLLSCPSLTALPDLRVLDERTLPLVLSPGLTSTRWQVRLPGDWSLPEPAEILVENEVGSFSSRLTLGADQTFVIERRAELRKTLVNPDSFAALRTLATAETRALRRRVRLVRPAD